jgi:hypothetical protein
MDRTPEDKPKSVFTPAKAEAFLEAIFSMSKWTDKVAEMNNAMLANQLWQHQSKHVSCLSYEYALMDEIMFRLDPTLRNGFQSQAQ